MKLNLFRTSAVIAAFTASIAFAEMDESGVSATTTAPAAKGFNNHLHSKVMISPAQLYQVPAGKTDVSLNFDSASTETKVTAGKTTTDGTGTDLKITGIYTVPSMPLKGGIDFSYLSASTEYKSSAGAKVKRDTTNMMFGPTFVYSAMDMVHVGASYKMWNKESKYKVDGATTQKNNYGIFNPAVVVAQKGWEAGLNYTSSAKEEAKTESDLEVQEPTTITIHGRYAVMPELAVGAAIGQRNWSDVELEDKKDTLKSQTTFAASVEWEMQALRVEGGLEWASEYFDKDAARGTDTIATMGLNAAADYMVTPVASVGAGLDYNWGDDKDSTNGDITVSDLGFQLRGNFAF